MLRLSCYFVDSVVASWGLGYYACRVFFNGVPRKVVLDDYVPVRKDGRLVSRRFSSMRYLDTLLFLGKVLSAHSSKKNEFWVSLLEKCFVKLMGGSYFMQGSNPGADLYHLTGWIPETIPFRVDIHTGSPDNHTPVVTGGHEAMDYAADPKWNAVWDQLFDGLQYGKYGTLSDFYNVLFFALSCISFLFYKC